VIAGGAANTNVTPGTSSGIRVANRCYFDRIHVRMTDDCPIRILAL